MFQRNKSCCYRKKDTRLLLLISLSLSNSLSPIDYHRFYECFCDSRGYDVLSICSWIWLKERNSQQAEFCTDPSKERSPFSLTWKVSMTDRHTYSVAFEVCPNTTKQKLDGKQVSCRAPLPISLKFDTVSPFGFT